MISEIDSDLLDANIELYPPWKRALELFLSERFAYETIISHEWFYAAFGIDMPTELTPFAVAQKAELQRLEQFRRLRQTLLERHQVDLVTEPGLGYIVIHPRDQARRAADDTARDMKRATRKGLDRAVNVNTTMLTAAERKTHADAQIRIGMFAAMMKPRRALPGAEEE